MQLLLQIFHQRKVFNLQSAVTVTLDFTLATEFRTVRKHGVFFNSFRLGRTFFRPKPFQRIIHVIRPVTRRSVWTVLTRVGLHAGLGPTSDIFYKQFKNYNLRSSDFPIPRFNTVKYGKHSIRYLGPYLWGKINKELRSKTNLQVFKKLSAHPWSDDAIPFLNLPWDNFRSSLGIILGPVSTVLSVPCPDKLYYTLYIFKYMYM